MIRPHARMYLCPACRWFRWVRPRSDCLLAGVNVIRRCPRCASAVMSFGGDWRSLLARWLRRRAR